MDGILGREKTLLKKWGLVSQPFFPTPPADLSYLMRVFTGRERETEEAIQTLYHGQNVLVRGMWGIGKTAFMIATLEKMRLEGDSIKEPFLTVLIKDFKGETADDLYRAVLLAIAKYLYDENNDVEAGHVVDSLIGKKVLNVFGEEVTAKGGLKILSVEVGAEGKNKSECSEGYEKIDPRHFLELFVNKALKNYKKIIVAIDDLDKRNPTDVKTMLDEALALIRDNRISFIMTGRTLSLAQDVYAAVLGTRTSQIVLNEFDAPTLVRMAAKYLAVVRQEPRGEYEPFEKNVLDEIATKSYGIARQFMIIAERTFSAAIRKNIETIDRKNFRICLEDIKSEVELQLTPQMRHILYLAKKPSGLSEDISDVTLDELNFTTYVELMPYLDNLVQNDLLIKIDDGKKTRFEASKILLPSHKK